MNNRLESLTNPSRARDAQRQEAERFRLFIDAVKDYAIFTLDPEGRVSTWNEGAARLKGYTASDIIGKHFSIFYPAADVQRGKPAWELEVALREGRVEDEGWRVRKDGSRFWANVVITATRDRSGQLLGFIKVTRDFTERMKSQEELQRANSKLAASEKSLRELTVHLLRSQDDERRRIGRELHDSLGQYLAILKMNLDSVSSLVDEGVAKHDIGRCVRLADDALREVRTISYLLYPPMLEEVGLKAAITWYLEGFAQRSNIRTTFDIDEEFGRLVPEAELALFRVLQESLTNVHRHSGTSRASVRLSFVNEEAILEIQDEGKGIPPNLLREAQGGIGFRGVGLRGMSERLRQLGGKLELLSTTQGTTVKAILPATQRQQPPNQG